MKWTGAIFFSPAAFACASDRDLAVLFGLCSRAGASSFHHLFAHDCQLVQTTRQEKTVNGARELKRGQRDTLIVEGEHGTYLCRQTLLRTPRAKAAPLPCGASVLRPNCRAIGRQPGRRQNALCLHLELVERGNSAIIIAAGTA